MNQENLLEKKEVDGEKESMKDWRLMERRNPWKIGQGQGGTRRIPLRLWNQLTNYVFASSRVIGSAQSYAGHVMVSRTGNMITTS
ncbi:hypothetical protein Scep_004899 [Stephania cephalantha]|uniref:Uncharacterized protein n=1 Tax=Stephania cephalantha TaxID=152367 RepID=A0AAP0KVT6_9MAGN